LFQQPGEDLFGDALMDEEPRAGAAYLPRVPEAGEKRPGDRTIEVGIIEDDVRGFATEL
jgi:hypothetical protein